MPGERFPAAFASLRAMKKADAPHRDTSASYRLWDSNPHSEELDFESSASTNSAKPAAGVITRLLNRKVCALSSPKHAYFARARPCGGADRPEPPPERLVGMSKKSCSAAFFVLGCASAQVLRDGWQSG